MAGVHVGKAVTLFFANAIIDPDPFHGGMSKKHLCGLQLRQWPFLPASGQNKDIKHKLITRLSSFLILLSSAEKGVPSCVFF
jgi:hypothetical protein